MNILERLQSELSQMQGMGLKRKLYPQLDKKINFTSNDYLGLSKDPRVLQAFQEGMEQYGLGSVGSRLLGGDRDSFHQLESKWSQWKGVERSLFYNSGFNANISIPSALCSKETHLFSDKLNHASLYDGIQLSPGQLHRYAHNDLEHLESLLKKYSGEGIILTESIFSMDGDQAPLLEIQALAERYECILIVDEAHSDGVMGPEGKGLVHELQLEDKVDLVISTFGKAYGCSGAIVAGRSILIDTLLQKSRGFTYTTAIPPAMAHAISTSIDVSIEESHRRENLQTLSSDFRQALQENGFDIAGSQSQIVPIVLGSNERALMWAEEIQQRGYWVQAIRQPTVPQGSARLRINICAHHIQEQVEGLLKLILKIQESEGVGPS